MTHEHDAKTGQEVVRFRLRDEPTDPAIRLAVGDVAHTMRQALDHLAYRLAIVVCGTDPPCNADVSQFPITTGIGAFKGGIAKKVGPAAKMPPGLFDLLESMQPYNGGDWARLQTLHTLDNIDKHRFPPIVAGIGDVAAVDTSIVGKIDFQHAGNHALKDGDEILRFTSNPGEQFYADFTIARIVAFGESFEVAPGERVGIVLRDIGALIEETIIPQLEPFF